MNKDHLARAKDYIAIAESGDSKLAAYKKGADEIIKAREHDPRLGWREIGERVGKSYEWVRKLVQWRTSVKVPTELPFGGHQENEARYERHARTILKDPGRFEQVIPDLPTKALHELANRADDEIVGRRQAREAEHGTDRTVGSLMGGRKAAEELRDEFSPRNLYVDHLVIRVHNNALELASWIQRKGGVLLGSMEPQQALDYLLEAEQEIAEARAAVQEQISDSAGVR